MAGRAPRRPKRSRTPPPKPAATTDATRRNRLVVALVVFVMALAVRAVHIWQIQRAPFFDLKLGDAAGYDAWARRIAAGDWIGDGIFYQAPLYPYVLALVYKIAGTSPLIVRGVQGIVSAASCALIADAGFQLFGRRAGIVAGLMLAAYAPAIFLDTLIQKSVLDQFFLAMALWLVARLLSRERRLPHDAESARIVERAGHDVAAMSAMPVGQAAPTSHAKPGLAAACQLGITIGFLSLTRENAGILLLPLLLWFALERTLTARERIGRCALVLAGAAVIVTPVAARNWAVGHELVLTTSQFGPNLYIGNNPRADGTYKPLRPFREKPDFERQDATELAEQALGRRLAPVEVSRYYSHQVVEFVRTHPAEWLRLLGRKLVLAWNAVEIADTEDQYTYAEWSWPAAFGKLWHFGVLAPLAVFGIWITARDWRRLWLLHLMLVSYLASLVIFYVFARYRFPLVSFLVLFAAAGVARAADFFRTRRRREVWVCLAATAAVAVLCNVRMVAVSQLEAGTHYNIGVGLEARGDDNGALAEYETAVRLDPTIAPAHTNLGLLLAKHDRLAEAADEFARALQLAPDPRLRNNLAVVLGRQGKVAEAIREGEEAVAGSPDYLEARRTLASLLVRAGRLEEAASEYREASRLAPRDATLHLEFGALLVRSGQTDEAIAVLERATSVAPGDLRARTALASVYAQAGRLDEAARQLRMAIQIAPDRADLHNNLGIVLAEQGQVRAAGQEFERALALNPDDPQTRRNVERIRGRR